MRTARQTDWGWFWEGRLSFYRRWGYDRRKQSTGRWGERLALFHLRRLKWDLVCRNWSTGWGEIDLIGYDGASLVFVEVKTREVRSPGQRAEDNFTPAKGQRIERLALAFLRRHSLSDTSYRLDLIAIETLDRKDFLLRHFILPERMVWNRRALSEK